jgi:hypothetical protein
MPDDAIKASPRKSGQKYQVHIIPPLRVDPTSTEEFDTLAEAEFRQREVEQMQGYGVTIQTINYHDPAALQPTITPRVSWSPVAAADIIGAAKTLGNIGALQRFITYSGLDVPTLLGFASTELDLAKDAAKRASNSDRDRHAINAVHYAKMTLDCLFDAYLERDYLDRPPRLRPQASFVEKLTLVRKRLGEHLVPGALISQVVADPRDVAQHERIAPSPLQAQTAIEATRMIVQATTKTTNPLEGCALAGWLPGNFNQLPDGGHEAYILSLPSVFGLLWRGRDGNARACVGQGDKDVAEVQYALLTDFDEEEHLELLRIFDVFGKQSRTVYNESAVRELLVAAGLDGPPAVASATRQE